MHRYDAVIIGGGFGGLVCGALLSKEGMRVCVLEKNSRAGGCLQSFKRNGVTFDTGVHYIGSLDSGQPLERIFSYLGLTDKLELRRMNENAYDIITFASGKKEYTHPIGYDRVIDSLSQDFPSEHEAIKKYAEELRRVNNSFAVNNLLPGGGELPDTSFFSTSTIDFLSSITANRTLQNVLAGSNLLYAGESTRTPMYIHALVNHSYIQSAYRLGGGSEQIAEILSAFIQSSGGDVLVNSEAVSFDYSPAGEIKHVQLKSGEMIAGTHYISSIHPSLTVSMIDPARLRKPYLERISNLENTISVFGLYCVMKEGAFPYSDSNYYHYRNDTVWTIESYEKSRWPENFFMSFAPQKDERSWARGVQVLCYMKYEDVAQWADTTVERRGDNYKAFKLEKAQELLALIDERFPGFSASVDSYYTSTPLTYRDYTGTVNGSMYGIFHDANNYIHSHVSTKTRIPNLYLAGQNVNLHGLLGVAISSLMTCGNLCGMDSLLEKIRNC